MTKPGIKTILCIFLSIGCSCILSAQDKLDSLRAVLKTQVTDTSKVSTLLQLYESLKFEEQDKAREYLEESLNLSTTLDFEKGLLNSLLAKGEYFETTGYQDSALITYQKAQKVGEKLDQRRGIIESFIGMGSAFSSLQRLNEADSIAFLGIALAKKTPIDSLSMTQFYTILSNTTYFRNDYEKSIGFDRKALEYNASDLRKRARSFLNIGTTYDLLSDYEKSGEYYEKALEAAKAAEDERMIALVQSEMGLLKIKLKEFDEGRKLSELSLTHFKAVNDKVMTAHVLENVSRIHVELEEFDQAITKLEKALSLASEVNSLSSEAHFTYQLALAYYKKKDYPNAEKYFLEAKSKFDALEESNMQTRVMSCLSDLYATKRDYKKAFEYLQVVKARDDSLLTATSAKNIAEMEEKYQNEQKQQEIDLLSAENEISALRIQKQQNLRNYLLLGAFLLLVIIGVVYNRYQLKTRANAKLKALDTLKTNFFTNISHEFRTPLTLILSPLQELMGKKNDKETAHALSIIHRNAKVLTNLTNQLLDLSKLEAGKLSLTVTEGDLKSVLKVVCASFESLAVAHNVEFIRDLKDAPEQAYFDEDKVQKVLNNLLSNAFKFTSKEGKVMIRAFQDQQGVSIAIQDTGNGISQEDQKLIFKRFHQNQTNAPDAAGTGVGLTLSKELALLHHGDIMVQSEKDAGATFTFHFPIKKSAYQPKEIQENTEEKDISISKPAIVTLEEEKTETASNDKIVLLVEDNPDLSNHMRSLLKDEFTVKQSANGKLGIQDALEIIPDIIVSDLMMPEVDGVELSNTLKANERTSHIPIILLTAKADRNTKLDGLKTGVDDFLTKPFDNEELKIRIQNLIAQREKLRSKYEQTLRLAPSQIKVQSPEETFIKRALQVVDTNLGNSEFTVEAFQKDMGMSRMQLHRKLKALTHFSASEFIRDIRLQRAADLLSHNGMNVSEVAYSCGFNSTSYFTQCFKQKFGTSPSKHNSTL
ncbi:MAG: tetratricopeptide repeat protein [Bacteroidota bacterium]